MDEIIGKVIDVCAKYDCREVTTHFFPKRNSYCVLCGYKGGEVQISNGEIKGVSGDDEFKRFLEKELKSPVKF